MSCCWIRIDRPCVYEAGVGASSSLYAISVVLGTGLSRLDSTGPAPRCGRTCSPHQGIIVRNRALLSALGWSERQRMCCLLSFFTTARKFYLTAPALISSTTEGSSSVEVSPRASVSPSATLRKILRMILPERVLGSPDTIWILSGLAIGPIS